MAKQKKVDEGAVKLAEYMNAASKSPEYIDACANGMRENITVGERVWLAGVGPAQAPVMVVTAIATADEVSDKVKAGMNWDTMEPRYVPKKPRAFESPLHLAYKDLAMQRGLNLDKCFCVPMVRFRPDMHPKAASKPTAELLKMFLPILKADIRRVKPAIVVCADKLVFNMLVKVPGIQFSESDLYGAWFYNSDLNVRVYLTKKYTMVDKLDFRQRFLQDFGIIKAELDAMDGKRIERTPLNITVVRNSNDLRNLVSMLEAGNYKVLSVDCEWEGSHHVDGKLRSLQIAWSPTDGAYIRFMDDKLCYAFDVDYREAGRILSAWLDRPEVRYIGHHLAADLVWMHHVLGLQYRGKGLLDTEFSVQACDESRELGLDVLALTYTDLGKYDMDLIIWKKKHADLVKDGYGRIPDDIMIPYAVKDVVAVYRAWPEVQAWLERQGLVEYWNNILGPMVMDVFTYLCLVGIPIDHARIDEMRTLYTWARDEFGKEFASEVVAESEELMKSALEEAGCGWMYPRIKDEMDLGNHEVIKSLAAATGSSKVEATALHYINAPAFKASSSGQMRLWLFDVKGYTPLKTTSLKDQGMPAMSWEKIMAKPPEEQAKYTPSTDQATLETLASRYGDKVLDSLLQYKKICTVCKNFLKEPERDKNGQVVREGGMHYWLASDDAIHGALSTTETGRIRSWNPNVLNWSGYVHARLATAVEKTLTLRASQGRVPEYLKKYVGVKGKNLPTIRSVSMARPGWCMVEADLQTAEMRGLAFISGDLKFLDTLLGVDHNFAFVADEFVPDGVDPGECIVRTSFPEYIEYPEDKDKFLYAVFAGGTRHTFTENQLKRDEKGNIVHPRCDIHWEISERAQRKAREAMDKKKDRGAGKVVNFCVAGSTGIIVRKNGKVSVKNIADLVREGVFEAWDGTEWVTTQAVDRGWQKVIRHQSGLTATPDHIVWTESGPMTLLEATVRLETLLGQDEMGRYKYGTAPPVLEAGDVPQEVYARRALVRDIMLFGYNGTSTTRQNTYDRFGIGLPSCPVQNLAQAAGLLALVLSWDHCFDLVDCGEHHRFATVYGLVHNSSSYGGQAASLQRKIESDTGHQVPVEMVEAMLQAIVDRAPRADEFFKEMENMPFTKGFIRAASGRLRHCTAFGSEGEKLSKRTRDGAVSALGRECRNYLMQESVGAVASLALQNTLAFKERFGLEGGVVVCLYDSLVVHCPYHERMIWSEALEVYMHLANGWAYGNNLLRYSIDLEFNAGWSTHSQDREWNDHMKDPAFEPTPDRLKPAMDYILALKKLYTEHPEASVYNKKELVCPLRYIG